MVTPMGDIYNHDLHIIKLWFGSNDMESSTQCSLDFIVGNVGFFIAHTNGEH